MRVLRLSSLVCLSLAFIYQSYLLYCSLIVFFFFFYCRLFFYFISLCSFLSFFFFFFLIIRRPPSSPLFPYPPLFRFCSALCPLRGGPPRAPCRTVSRSRPPTSRPTRWGSPVPRWVGRAPRRATRAGPPPG